MSSFWEMGLGKSVITLTALFDLLLDSFMIGKALVIAPLRVARDTWPTEIRKWDHLDGLKFSEEARVPGNPKNSAVENTAIRIVELEEEIADDILHLV